MKHLSRQPWDIVTKHTEKVNWFNTGEKLLWRRKLWLLAWGRAGGKM